MEIDQLVQKILLVSNTNINYRPGRFISVQEAHMENSGQNRLLVIRMSV